MKRYWVILLLPLLCVACERGRNYFPKHVDKAEIQIVRFDSALLALQDLSTPLNTEVADLYSAYGEFMPFYVENIMGINAADTSEVAATLPMFLNDTVYGFQETNRSVRRIYANMSDVESQLGDAFGRLRYLYPDCEVPEITCLVSGFNASLFFWEPLNIEVFRDEKLRIGVSLDMYLGKDYPLYNKVVWNYQKQTMDKKFIAGDVVSACLFRMIPFNSSKSRLLENMLYRGKVMYLMSVLMPKEKPWDVMGYTKEQWQWLEHNERAIWQLMIDRHDIFKTENTVLTSYLNDGPYTAEVSQEAPPRLGTWIGWRIAQSYMEHNQEVSLQQLMSEPDAQKIMEQSFYRP